MRRICREGDRALLQKKKKKKKVRKEGGKVAPRGKKKSGSFAEKNVKAVQARNDGQKKNP